MIFYNKMLSKRSAFETYLDWFTLKKKKKFFQKFEYIFISFPHIILEGKALEHTPPDSTKL